jgi:hypothetical protein
MAYRGGASCATGTGVEAPRLNQGGQAMRIISIAALATFAVAPIAAQAATPLQKETAVWQTFKDKNAKAFSAMFAPNYVGLYEDGPATVATELSHLKIGKIDSFKISNFADRMIDPDDMLMTYVVDVKGAMGKTDISGKYHAASLWHRTGNKWLGVYHTEIKAK